MDRRAPAGWGLLSHPSQKSAKDGADTAGRTDVFTRGSRNGAPDRLWQGKKYAPLLLTQPNRPFSHFPDGTDTKGMRVGVIRSDTVALWSLPSVPGFLRERKVTARP